MWLQFSLQIKQAIKQILNSYVTTERRISEISCTIICSLQSDLKSCGVLNLAMDESPDIQDIPQLAIFVLYVKNDGIVRRILRPDKLKGNYEGHWHQKMHITKIY